MATFSSNVLQWIIYDAYLQDYAAQMLEKELERERKEKEKAPVSRHTPAPKKIAGRAQLSEAVQGRVFECWKVLERMINLNTYDDIAKGMKLLQGAIRLKMYLVQLWTVMTSFVVFLCRFLKNVTCKVINISMSI